MVITLLVISVNALDLYFSLKGLKHPLFIKGELTIKFLEVSHGIGNHHMRNLKVYARMRSIHLE